MRELIESRRDRYLEWLRQACSIPSLAGNPEGLQAMVAWLEGTLGPLGAATERLTFDSAPDVLLAHLGSGERTVLVYDHYDVQPVDPVSLWKKDPFVPALENGLLYARGVADNKGDLVARLAAFEVYRDHFGELPVRLKLLIEGEEEVGSPSFPEVVERYADKLGADGCIWEGAGVNHAGAPELVFGAKGLAYLELVCSGLNDDQHSSVAVYAPSPVWRLVEALATLRDVDGRVLVDGFYEDVLAPTPEDLTALETLPFDEEAEKQRLGISEFVGGASGLELLTRAHFEPTCNIAGIHAGFTVPGGSKTVLPKQALAKLDLRLVPEQVPEDIVAKIRAHLEAHDFGDISVTTLGLEHPARSPMDSLIGRAATIACEPVYDLPPAVSPLMIATGPMHPIAHFLGIPTVSPAGVCRPDSKIHAPNENVAVTDFLDTIEYTIEWIRAFATV
ncbi:MAG: M20/M25/M40 family metallo-hydrolase [Actinomycetota bacterium]|nr:M20/M25/M40 family metallo-hydrolase [Actinomycetota bacterium]